MKGALVSLVAGSFRSMAVLRTYFGREEVLHMREELMPQASEPTTYADAVVRGLVAALTWMEH